MSAGFVQLDRDVSYPSREVFPVAWTPQRKQGDLASATVAPFAIFPIFGGGRSRRVSFLIRAQASARVCGGFLLNDGLYFLDAASVH